MTLFKENYPAPDVNDDSAFRQWLVDGIFHLDECIDTMKQQITAAATWQQAADGRRAKREWQTEDTARRKELHRSMLSKGYEVFKEISRSGLVIAGALAVGGVVGGALMKLVGL